MSAALPSRHAGPGRSESKEASQRLLIPISISQLPYSPSMSRPAAYIQLAEKMLEIKCTGSSVPILDVSYAFRTFTLSCRMMLSVHRRPGQRWEGARQCTDSVSHHLEIFYKGYTRTTRSQPTSFPITSNTFSPTWVFVYRPLLAFDPMKELSRVRQVASHWHWQNSRGMFSPPVLTRL